MKSLMYLPNVTERDLKLQISCSNPWLLCKKRKFTNQSLKNVRQHLGTCALYQR